MTLPRWSAATGHSSAATWQQQFDLIVYVTRILPPRQYESSEWPARRHVKKTEARQGFHLFYTCHRTRYSPPTLKEQSSSQQQSGKAPPGFLLLLLLLLLKISSFLGLYPSTAGHYFLSPPVLFLDSLFPTLPQHRQCRSSLSSSF